MHNNFSHVAVKGITISIPKQAIDIENELIFFNNDPKKLARAKKIVGYGKRHVVPEGVTATDLCEDAAKSLLSITKTDPSCIDAILLVTQSPDYFHPAGACILQDHLGLSIDCATLDVSLGCSGYV